MVSFSCQMRMPSKSFWRKNRKRVMLRVHRTNGFLSPNFIYSPKRGRGLGSTYMALWCRCQSGESSTQIVPTITLAFRQANHTVIRFEWRTSEHGRAAPSHHIKQRPNNASLPSPSPRGTESTYLLFST